MKCKKCEEYKKVQDSIRVYSYLMMALGCFLIAIGLISMSMRGTI